MISEETNIGGGLLELPEDKRDLSFAGVYGAAKLEDCDRPCGGRRLPIRRVATGRRLGSKLEPLFHNFFRLFTL